MKNKLVFLLSACIMLMATACDNNRSNRLNVNVYGSDSAYKKKKNNSWLSPDKPRSSNFKNRKKK